MPFLVDLGGLEAKPTHPRDPSRSAARLHPGQVAGINRIGWPLSTGLGGRFPPDWVAAFHRNAHEDVWVKALLDGGMPARLAISDVRFPNEADAIRAFGGLVVRVERPGVGPINGHESEIALDGYDFDLVVVNDGTLDELTDEMEAVLASCSSNGGV